LQRLTSEKAPPKRLSTVDRSGGARRSRGLRAGDLLLFRSHRWPARRTHPICRQRLHTSQRRDVTDANSSPRRRVRRDGYTIACGSHEGMPLRHFAPRLPHIAIILTYDCVLMDSLLNCFFPKRGGREYPAVAYPHARAPGLVVHATGTGRAGRPSRRPSCRRSGRRQCLAVEPPASRSVWWFARGARLRVMADNHARTVAHLFVYEVAQLYG
jgi:hypothetical protein